LFSPKSHSQPLTEEELEDLVAQLTQKQQQEQEESILRSVETHDLKEILAGIDTYLQRLSDIDPDWERSRSIRRRVIALLQPYYHVLQERRHQATQTTLLSYFKKLRASS
jgi:light-regulated signal transduction histidine kinase (bacteriophytochrome)